MVYKAGPVMVKQKSVPHSPWRPWPNTAYLGKGEEENYNGGLAKL